MTRINFKDSHFSREDLINFFEKNDFLFPDPFSYHVDISTYMNRLIDLGEVLLMVIDEKIVGMACAYMNDYITYIGHLQVLLVDEKFQKKGIGRNLAKAVLDLAKEKGMQECVLTIDKENRKAEALYKAIGYVDSNEKHKKDNKKYMIYKWMEK